MNDPLRRIPVWFRRARFFAALGGIAFVSLWSHDNLEEHVSKEVQSKDYVIHLGCYALLAACSLWAWARRSMPWHSRAVAAILCFLYGALMEVLQLLPVVGRSCSLLDIRQNAIGALLGAIALPRFLWPEKARLCESATVREGDRARGRNLKSEI